MVSHSPDQPEASSTGSTAAHPNTSTASPAQAADSEASQTEAVTTSQSTADIQLNSSINHSNASQRAISPTAASRPAQQSDSAIETLQNLKSRLNAQICTYPHFPNEGVTFEDIMPIFANYTAHRHLIDAIELLISNHFGSSMGEKSNIDVIVGLESRGFLFGPSLALRLAAAFVPVRKAGKLPGDTITESYEKEYGKDSFQIQSNVIHPGERVLIVDDVIATGGSAQAAGKMVRRCGGSLLGFVFLKELDFLKGRDKLDAPVYTLL